MTEKEYRSRTYLPTKLDNATRRFLAAMREARRFGMESEVNAAWDALITEAQVDAINRGESIGFGDGRP